MTIFERIREDHVIQRMLVKKLVETHGDTSERKEIFKKLKSELEAHAVAEERCFYVPLIESDLTQEKARHSISEHHEMDEMIAELEGTSMDSPGWLVTAKKLKHEVEHHLDEEEHEVFQMAGKVLTEKQKVELTKEFSNIKKEAEEQV